MSKNKLVKYERYNINSMPQFEDAVMEMTDAEERRIHVESMHNVNEYCEYKEMKDKPEIWEDGYKAIINKKSGEIAQIATDSYTVMPHRDFFSLLPSALSSCGVQNISGYILEKDCGNEYTVRVNFKDILIEEPLIGKNIMMGAQFNNSFNKNKTASGSAFTLRLTCLNGATMSSLIPECEFSRNHNASSYGKMLDDILKKMDKFIYGLVNSGEVMTKIIQRALDSEIIFDNPMQLYSSMEELFGSKKHGEAIGDIARRVAKKKQNDPTLYLNRWELYNSITDHASHNAMTPDVFNQIVAKAEKNVLNTKGNIPMPIPVRR